MDFGQNAYTALYAFCALRAMLFWPKCIYRAMGCFAYCAQCAFDRLRAMRFGDFGIECAYGAIYAKSRVTAGAGCAGKNLAMLCGDLPAKIQIQHPLIHPPHIPLPGYTLKVPP